MHHSAERQPDTLDPIPNEAVGSVQGEWDKAFINGDRLVLKASGQAITLAECTRQYCKMMHNGVSYEARLGVDGKLHWNDGDVWSRQVASAIKTQMTTTDVPTQADAFIGEWMYSSTLGYTVIRESGEFMMKEVTADGLVIDGILKERGDCLEGDLFRCNPQQAIHWGSIRLRLAHSTPGKEELISNFKRPGSNQWDADVRAARKKVSPQMQATASAASASPPLQVPATSNVPQVRSEIGNEIPSENDNSTILMNISSRMARMESTNHEMMQNMVQSLADMKAAFADLQGEATSFFDKFTSSSDLRTAHGEYERKAKGKGPFRDGDVQASMGMASDDSHAFALRVSNPARVHMEMKALDKQPHVARRGDTTIKVKNKRRMFVDVDEMKNQVRHAILKPTDVSRFYNDSLSARIAMSSQFELCTLTMIAVNALWVGIDVDVNGSKSIKDKHFVYQIVDYSFLIYFVVEIIIRFCAFKLKRSCLRDFWFTFDSTIVVLTVFDTLLPYIVGSSAFNSSIIRLARVVRISRTGRIAHLLKDVPEISVITKGFGMACRSVASILLLLTVLTYVFAVAFRFLTAETEVGNTYFRSVPHGMKVLAITAIMPDVERMIDDSSEEHILVGLLVVVFITAVSLTLLNMLVGVLCEVVSVLSAMEKEEQRVQSVKRELLRIFQDYGIDAGVKGVISQQEFQGMLLNVPVAHALRDVGVDPVGLIDFIEYIFSCGELNQGSQSFENGLSFDKLVELICQLAGDNQATVKDVVDTRQVMLRHLVNIQDSLDMVLGRASSNVSIM